ncbi:nuclear transport factor 2 family protein [Pseudomonas sp. BN606]|uniref:nuclear transport factor 2 family protein n=1 Tax=Pseudomonas sp. BN606 TaxID=2567894 RepID=UPI002455A6CC|nr:nuclear transport factor 2 family protein [Pseudomonas sp. BN606]
MKSALEVAQLFFASYRAHDLTKMLACFAPEGRIDYIPIALEGFAEEAGCSIWSALIEVFPDLSNEITATYPCADGRTVILEVTISGTQSRDAFGIRNKGRQFHLPHVFIVRIDDHQRISQMKAYWDNAAWFAALGRTSLVETP